MCEGVCIERKHESHKTLMANGCRGICQCEVKESVSVKGVRLRLSVRLKSARFRSVKLGSSSRSVKGQSK